MGENSAIEWTDATFNPWVGCTKVSPACDHCYAEAWAKRTGHPELWAGERRKTGVQNWNLPLKWNRQAEVAGVRRKVFCASLADVFDNQVPSEWRMDLYALIGMTPHLDWLLLTKRPQNIAKMMPKSEGLPFFPNVWLGTTVENQEEADRRIPDLLAVPAVIHFLSCEPLLGLVSLRQWLCTMQPDGSPAWCNDSDLNWVICGGESGSKRRPMDLTWARSLRDQCAAASVPFFGKQDDKVRPLPPDLQIRQFPEVRI
jgi:protein gp37